MQFVWFFVSTSNKRILILHAQIQKGVGLDASWHAAYADSAYIYVGGLDFRMTEGDVITIFSQVCYELFQHLCFLLT